MKTPKLIKHGIMYSMLIGSLLTIGSCKKEKSSKNSVDDVFGGWTEIQAMEGTARELHFSQNGTFFMRLTYFKIPISFSQFSGTFKIKGDSLSVTVKEQLTQEGNQPSVIMPMNTKLYDDATFTITNAILTLKYTTYPADAPVATQVKFQKQLPD